MNNRFKAPSLMTKILIILVLASIIFAAVITNYKKVDKGREQIAALKSILSAELKYYKRHESWAYDSAWTAQPTYLAEEDPVVISLMGKLGIDNPNSRPDRGWNYYFAWVNLGGGGKGAGDLKSSIAFHAINIRNPRHMLVLRADDAGKMQFLENQYFGTPDSKWYGRKY